MNNIKKLCSSMLKYAVSLCLATSLVTTNVSAYTATMYLSSNYEDEYIQVNITNNYSSIRIMPELEELGYNYVRASLFDGEESFELDVFDTGIARTFDLSTYEDGEYYIEIEASEKENGTYASYLTGFNGIHIEISRGDISFIDSMAYTYNESAREEYPTTDVALDSYLDIECPKLADEVDDIVTGAYSSYEIALAIHDYITEEIAVDTSATKYNGSYTDPYDVFDYERASSLGFANLTAEMLRLAGVPAMVIKGQVIDTDEEEWTRSMCRSETINHAWVEFYDEDDDEWKIMDTYLDTASYYRGGKTYDYGTKYHLYFDITLDQFSNTHCIKEVEEYTDDTIYVNSITLSSSALLLDEDGKEYIDATVYPINAANKTLKYTSSDTTVATVNNAGLVTAQGEGSAVITVSSTDGSDVSVKCNVEVGSSIVKKIEVSRDELDMNINEAVYLTIDVLPKTAKDRSYKISSSNTSVVRVTSAGVVSARSAGDAVITITANDDSDIEVEIPVSVSGKITKSFIEIDESVYELMTGETTHIGLNYGSTVGYSSITLESSDEDVVRVSSNGTLTAVGEGIARIRATLEDGSDLYDTCFVSVEENTTNDGYTVVSLEETKLEMAIGDMESIEATVTPNTTLSYVSTNTSVVTVTSKGVVEAVGAGTANVIVSANDGSGAYASATITVSGDNSLVNTIELGNDKALVEIGNTYTINATVKPDSAKNKKLSYVSSNTSVATVNDNGVVTARKEGESIITIRSTDGSGISTTLLVTTTDEEVVYIEEITIADPILTLKVGQSYSLDESVSPKDATLDDLLFTSSDEEVATVSAKGKIYAEDIGDAVITIKAQDGSGKFVTCAVEVIGKNEDILVSSISIENEPLELSVGDSSKLKIAVYPSTADDQTVTYTSMNKNVATVSSTGQVSAVGAGTTYISVTANDDGKKQATIKVTVTKVEEPEPEEPEEPETPKLDLSAYSAMNMTVYPSSRVTKIKQNGIGFTVEGYMFEQGADCIYNDARNWREIVFVNANNASTAYAYRKQVTNVYNPWLNSNMTATVNGKYKLNYANYTVTVNPSSMNKYAGNVPGQ
ncbi:MAG: Ig-like domain-containing protein, partial [Erysipelotrichales bacterium]|nr:Ig-like domain-containing protein [Erysipelotrichales bacterium]